MLTQKNISFLLSARQDLKNAAAVEKLWNHYFPIVLPIANSFLSVYHLNTKQNLEDLIQDCFVIFCEYVDSFDRGNHCFGYYLKVHMEREIEAAVKSKYLLQQKEFG